MTDTTNLEQSDFIDWGSEQAYEKAVGVGECAGVVIDLIATLLLESEEKLENASESLKLNQFSDSIYYTYSSIVNTAKAFNDRIDFDGVVLTKLDGDARGGAALSIKSITGKPIRFVGMGEKLDALEPFHPDRIVSRILGMGDVMSLVEKAEKILKRKSRRSYKKSSRPTALLLKIFATS